MAKPKKQKKVIDPESLPYEVGKFKPPKSGQFPKGTSGNPSGKSKTPKRKEKTQEDYYSEVVARQLPDGTIVEMTRREMAYDNNSRLAAKGDHKAFKILLEHDRRKEAGETDPDPLIFDEGLRKELIAQLNAENEANARREDIANPDDKKDDKDG